MIALAGVLFKYITNRAFIPVRPLLAPVVNLDFLMKYALLSRLKYTKIIAYTLIIISERVVSYYNNINFIESALIGVTSSWIFSQIS